jgi:hypothetical protein
MNVLSQKSLAESLGLSVDELSESLRKREEAIKSGKSLAQVTEEETAQALERQTIQDKFNASVLKLQDFFGNLISGPVGKFLEILTNSLDIIKYIYEIFPYLCDLKFTSKMEDELDKIINASITKDVILNELYNKIKYSIDTVTVATVATGCSDSTGTSGSKEKKTGILTTRFGTCYYNKELDKYTNIEPYLTWRQLKKEELTDKLSEFASATDNLEEIFENREQIEISKHYERLPKPTLVSIQEFLDGKIYHRNPLKDQE